MESLQDIVARQQAASPRYFDDPEKDRMMATILSLAEEVCVLRDRLDTSRRLAADGKPATNPNIEACAIPAAVLEDRLEAHTAFFAATLAGLSPRD
jgi:hypothetical protein